MARCAERREVVERVRATLPAWHDMVHVTAGRAALCAGSVVSQATGGRELVPFPCAVVRARRRVRFRDGRGLDIQPLVDQVRGVRERMIHASSLPHCNAEDKPSLRATVTARPWQRDHATMAVGHNPDRMYMVYGIWYVCMCICIYVYVLYLYISIYIYYYLLLINTKLYITTSILSSPDESQQNRANRKLVAA